MFTRTSLDEDRMTRVFLWNKDQFQQNFQIESILTYFTVIHTGYRINIVNIMCRCKGLLSLRLRQKRALYLSVWQVTPLWKRPMVTIHYNSSLTFWYTINLNMILKITCSCKLTNLQIIQSMHLIKQTVIKFLFYN